MVSVFDVEEIGAEVLAEELEITAEVAAQLMTVAAARAKEVSAQQQIEKEEAEKRRAEEQAATAAILAGAAGRDGPLDPDAAAAAILGAGKATSDEAESRADDILGG
jgi:hypothetical protein